MSIEREFVFLTFQCAVIKCYTLYVVQIYILYSLNVNMMSCRNIILIFDKLLFAAIVFINEIPIKFS